MPRRASKEKVRETELGDLHKVISGIETRVAVKLSERGLMDRLSNFWRNEKDLNREEIARLPKAAEWSNQLTEALESGSIKKLERV